MAVNDIRVVTLPGGETVPALGQGTWLMGEAPERKADEVRALRRGIDLGMTLIDTAEMYADGGAEEVVREAVAGRRERVFLVSKVLPSNASRTGTIKACETSLRRLGTDRIDLYLLHWRGGIPLAETVEALRTLTQAGKIRYGGVSNLDVADLGEWVGLGGDDVLATDQVLYNLGRRGPEFELLPWCRRMRVPLMAYSPIEQGRLLRNPILKQIAERHGTSAAQIALAWVLRHPDIIAIPKASRTAHVEENRAALDIVLQEEDMRRLDEAFPPPHRKRPLEML